ncbi:DinB family protein [Streptomyces sp. NPDC057236]|uniref:DinB family protein n=1 Tax=Streptomyces sp. NPDC057236 TaxID=3346059 RepID=UPI00363ADE61
MSDHDDQEDPITVTTTAAPRPPALDAERADLLATLATARASLTTTARGLSGEQAVARPTVGALCLGGLIKHVASVEEAWTAFMTEGPSAMRHDLPDGVIRADLAAGTAREIPQWAVDHRNDFRMLPGDTLDGILARYARVAAGTEEIVASLPDLSAAHPLPEAPWHEPGAARSERGVLAHLISETAQHAGHTDILRGTLDGRTSA